MKGGVKVKRIVLGVLAHVDAGKTTLSEQLLYKAGVLRKIGRVDSGDTLLDSHSLEKERGITIFSSEATLNFDDTEISLIDTPGHVDFSAETERALSVLDACVLVISGTQGVQAHTRTLWKLLSAKGIPTFIFCSKMDFERANKDEIMADLKKELGTGFVDFTEDFSEEIAMLSESLLEKYLSGEAFEDREIEELIATRKCFPCYFGSGLRDIGINEFIEGIKKYAPQNIYPNDFSAIVYKISRDSKNERLTHIKVTGGSLAVRDTIVIDGKEQKVSGIRIYSGEKFVSVNEAVAGQVCAVTGLSNTFNGMGLGKAINEVKPFLEPVMNYRIILPEGEDAKSAFLKISTLTEEDPLLKITWNEKLSEINVRLMGEIQGEILKSIISDRFSLDVKLSEGRVVYKETIEETVEGVGHFEPLRHYAEVHLLLKPLKRGSGLKFKTNCSEDLLNKNWQRLILTHLNEKIHLGVLTGSPITDMEITLMSGRAHQKHTEGGDFREATYRGLRQGLMNAKSVLLEPYYEIKLTVPSEQTGRAMTDIRLRNGNINPPEIDGAVTVITGTAPVVTMNGYAKEVASYTSGKGKLSLTVCGYDKCHNEKEVIEKIAYDPEGDLQNTPDSVFCAHGGGFTVKWDKVPEYMHLESCFKKTDDVPILKTRNFHIDDKELEAIMEREFGPIKRPQYGKAKGSGTVTYSSSEKNREYFDIVQKGYVLVDGYNVIFAWDFLSRLADENLDLARNSLINILSNYSAYTKQEVVLVFDAYRVSPNPGHKYEMGNLHIAYTKENETADAYLEKLVSEIGKNSKVRVVTSDGMIQLSVLRAGILRVSAREFLEEVNEVEKRIDEFLDELKKDGKLKQIDGKI